MGRPQASQGLLGNAALLPRKDGVRVVMESDLSLRAYRVALNPFYSTDMNRPGAVHCLGLRAGFNPH
jgi:hypothetical protein